MVNAQILDPTIFKKLHLHNFCIERIQPNTLDMPFTKALLKVN